MYSIKVASKCFSAAHFIPEIGERIHGHNFELSVLIEGGLNKNFMVDDFNHIQKITDDICEEMDHKVLIPQNSKIIRLKADKNQINIKVNKKKYLLPLRDVVLLPIESTTAELIAEYICGRIKKTFKNAHTHIRVEMSEKEGFIACFE